MDLVKLGEELQVDEGVHSHPYRDTRGIWTAGVGHNLISHGCSADQIALWKINGIPKELIFKWFAEDISAAVKCVKEIFPSYEDLPDNVQRVLVNMAFNLMYGLKEWHNLRAHIARRDWQAASMSIMDSLFAKQVPNRCCRLAARMISD